MRFLVLAALVCSLAPGADKKVKPAEIQVLDLAVRRNNDVIELEGHVRNTSEKPISGLTLVFHFYASGHALITTQRTKVDEETLEPNAETTINAQTNSPPRAIEIEVSALNEKGRDLSVGKPGPYPIE